MGARPGAAPLFSRAGPAQESSCSTIAHRTPCWGVLRPMKGVKSAPASVWTDSSYPECDTHERSVKKEELLSCGHQTLDKFGIEVKKRRKCSTMCHQITKDSTVLINLGMLNGRINWTDPFGKLHFIQRK
ncbi:hypothetical protein WISP_91393 [Willisornis vidua]|uniref:Uncharacterized protein n=1 Tax=Willisornis vidua TaxID=1566151 RepID=A0ABQ9D6Z3_9PASS|nr:hypothetical protein WISP_91393 [Willisornis vidua]